jgi:hypothetical protein
MPFFLSGELYAFPKIGLAAAAEMPMSVQNQPCLSSPNGHLSESSPEGPVLLDGSGLALSAFPFTVLELDVEDCFPASILGGENLVLLQAEGMVQ